MKILFTIFFNTDVTPWCDSYFFFDYNSIDFPGLILLLNMLEFQPDLEKVDLTIFQKNGR